MERSHEGRVLCREEGDGGEWLPEPRLPTGPVGSFDSGLGGVFSMGRRATVRGGGHRAVHADLGNMATHALCANEAWAPVGRGRGKYNGVEVTVGHVMVPPCSSESAVAFTLL